MEWVISTEQLNKLGNSENDKHENFWKQDTDFQRSRSLRNRQNEQTMHDSNLWNGNDES